MQTTPFFKRIAHQRSSFVALMLSSMLLLGCGGDPAPAPAPTDGQADPAPGAPAAPAAQPAAPAAAAKPAAYQEAITLAGQAEAAAKSALAELQTVKSSEDLKAKLPAIKKHLDALPTNLEQAVAKAASLDPALQEELQRRFVAESTLNAASQQISQELARVMQLGDITSETNLDLVAYMTQWGQRVMQAMMKVQPGAAGAMPVIGTQPGTETGTNNGTTAE